jgi:hypothetical protein
MGNAVVLFEVGAPDDAPLAFYRELFGWDLLTVAGGLPGGAFTMVDTRGGEGIIGGISKNPVGEPWSGFYVETDDLRATLDRVTSLGGTTVITGPEFDGAPAVAIFKDPDGLLVGVMQAPGAEQHPSAGAGAPVTWFEIIGSDAARTERFYADVFGWTINGLGVPGYSVVDTGTERGIQGGIGGGQGACRAIVYARVADADQTMARAGQLGGTAATDQGLSDLKATARAALYGEVDASMKMAEFRDPAGNVFGVFSY